MQVDGAVRWALWEAAMQLEELPLCRPEYGGVAMIMRQVFNSTLVIHGLKVTVPML